MRLLLDTHTLYWYIEGAPQLKATTQKLIQDVSNEILLSPVSYWEIAIKVSLGKWKLNRSYLDFIALALNQYGFEVLAILPTHTAAVVELPFHPRDPFWLRHWSKRSPSSATTRHWMPTVSHGSGSNEYGNRHRTSGMTWRETNPFLA